MKKVPFSDYCRIVPGYAVIIICALISQSPAEEYYVDSRNGSDDNSGTSESQAWRSLSYVERQNFRAGDTVNFLRGSQWNESFTIDDSGEEGRPVMFRASGDGDMPVISTSGGNVVEIRGDWVIVDGFYLTGDRNTGVRINSGAVNNIVRNCELTELGAGFWVSGTDNLITANYVHDLNIVRNTQGGDDDNGAVGIWINASRVEVSHNRFVRCKAPSYDYVYDGGAVEWWVPDQGIDGSFVHHNYATGCEGFMESGGRGATLANVTVAYNVAVNNGWFGLLNTNGQYAVVLDNFKVENNTVIQTGPHEGWGATRSLHFFDDRDISFSVRNNIFYLDGWAVSDNPTLEHSNNIFYVLGNRGIGFDPDETDKTEDPLFTDLKGEEFSLLPESPAIDMGVELGYELDFNGLPAGTGEAPDAGAFEFQAGTSIVPSEADNACTAGGPVLFNQFQVLFVRHGKENTSQIIFDVMGRSGIRPSY